jgi:hypothetical protein
LTEEQPSQTDAKIAYLEDRLAAAGIDPGTVTENPAAEKANLFDKSREGELNKKLGQIHDRAENRTEAALAQKDVPSAKVDSFDDAFAKTYDFLNAPESEKATQRDASKLIETVRENAKRFGVTLSDEAALKAAMDLENQQVAAAASEHAPVVEHMRSAFKDASPVEGARWFSQVASNFRQDPVGTIAYLAGQTGMSAMQVAQQLAHRFGNQPMQAQPQS